MRASLLILLGLTVLLALSYAQSNGGKGGDGVVDDASVKVKDITKEKGWHLISQIFKNLFVFIKLIHRH